MAAQRDEISLKLLKNISRVSATNEGIFFFSAQEKFR